MKQTLRKYLSSRGSALFMVLSTMTALLIVVMAMYFSVVSSRSVQYTVFNQQQSYQSAVSIADTLLAGLKDGTLSSGSSDLLSALTSLNYDETTKKGDTISMNGGDFMAFSTAGSKQDNNQLGAYNVDITRLPNETIDGKDNMTFDVATTTSVNGVMETVHTYIHVQVNSPDAPPAPTQVFASTGYVPNDAFLDGGDFITDVFYDNENVVINAYGQKAMNLAGNLYAGGNVTIHKYINITDSDSSLWAIRGTFNADGNQPVKLKAGSTVFIGNGMNLSASTGFQNSDVYVNGDVYLKGNDFKSCRLFVNGNIHILSGWSDLGEVYFGNYMDMGGTTGQIINETANEWGGFNGGVNFNNGSPQVWDDSVTDALSFHDFMTELDGATQSTTYYKWVINDSKTSLPSYVKELDERDPTKANYVTLEFNQGDAASDSGIPANQFVQELTYSDSCKGAIIQDVKCNQGNTVCNHITLIIDTGMKKENTFTIRVQANRDRDGDDVNETFSWYPYDDANSSCYMNILVKGRGSVVIDVPKGVTYQDLSDQIFMHMGWFALLGGTTGTINGSTYYDSSGVRKGTTAAANLGFLHTVCDDSCSCCTYSEANSDEECPACNGKKKVVTCALHDYSVSYCPTCEPDRIPRKDDAMTTPYGLCSNRVDRVAVDNYLSGHPTAAALFESDGDGLVYPTTNIFLVSCEESADIRLSRTAQGDTVMQNGFWGYVYAPYMTFKGYGGNSGGGYVRFCGGMTVSDYILDDSMTYLACWPENMPTDLMGTECFENKIEGVVGKSWKITFGGY